MFDGNSAMEISKKVRETEEYKEELERVIKQVVITAEGGGCSCSIRILPQFHVLMALDLEERGLLSSTSAGNPVQLDWTRPERDKILRQRVTRQEGD